MSHTAPTLDQFVETFPEFAETAPAPIRRALALALRSVDESWTEGDYAEAIMLLAAHALSSDIAAAEQMGGGDIASESIGRISVSYRGATDVQLSGTSYGVRFAELRRLNHPPVILL